MEHDIVNTIGNWASIICSVGAAVALFVKPLREKLFGLKVMREAQKCSLRNQMLQIYKDNLATKTLTEDEYKNFKMLYDAYIALGGNSFIMRIWREIENEWTVVV